MAAANKSGTTIDFIGNKVVIIKENEAKVIEVKQKDIDEGNVDKIVKEVLKTWRPN